MTTQLSCYLRDPNDGTVPRRWLATDTMPIVSLKRRAFVPGADRCLRISAPRFSSEHTEWIAVFHPSDTGSNEASVVTGRDKRRCWAVGVVRAVRLVMLPPCRCVLDLQTLILRDMLRKCWGENYVPLSRICSLKHYKYVRRYCVMDIEYLAPFGGALCASYWMEAPAPDGVEAAAPQHLQ